MKRAHLGKAVLVAILGVAASTGCKRGVGGVSGAAGSAMKLIPKDATVVLSLNVKQLRGTKAWDSFMNKVLKADDRQRMDDLAKDCQLDVRKDIDNVLMGVNAASAENPEFVAIVSGNNIKEGPVVDCIKKKSGQDLTTVDYGGKKIYEQGGSTSTSFAFVDDHTLVAGSDEAWAKKAIDLSSGKGDDVSKNDALMALVKKTTTDKSFWGAGLIPDSIKQMAGQAGGQGEIVKKIKGIYGSIDLSSGVVADIDAQCETPADAKTLADTLSQQMDMLKGLFLAPQQLDFVAQDIKYTANGDTAKIDVNIPQPDVDKIVAAAQKMANDNGGEAPSGGGDTPGE